MSELSAQSGIYRPLDHPKVVQYHSLDALRTLAALPVILHHIHLDSHFLQAPMIEASWLMVDFFFVLSGFIICHVYFQDCSTQRHAVRFLGLRLARIYPLHLLTLLLVLGLELLHWVAQHSGVSQVAEGVSENNPFSFFAQLGLLGAHGFFDKVSWNLPAWSISAEFTCYLIFAFISMRLQRARWKVAAWTMLGIFGAGVVIKRGVFDDPTWGVFRGLCGFGLGVLVFAFLGQFRRAISAMSRQLCLGWLVAGMVLIPLVLHATGAGMISKLSGWLLLLAASALVIGSVVALRDEAPVLKGLGAGRFGCISYSIYMLHMPLIFAAQILWHKLFHYETGGGLLYQTSKVTGDVWGVGLLLLTCSVGWLSYRHLETPARMRIRKWFA